MAQQNSGGAQAPRPGNKLVKGGVKKRAITRAKKLGMAKQMRKGGVTKHEARMVRNRYGKEIGFKGGGAGGGGGGGKRKLSDLEKEVRANDRYEYAGQSKLLGQELRREVRHQGTIGQVYDRYAGVLESARQTAAAASQQEMAANAATSGALAQAQPAAPMPGLAGQLEGGQLEHQQLVAAQAGQHIGVLGQLANERASDTAGNAQVAAAGRQGTAVLEQIEQRQSGRRRQEAIETKRTDLSKERRDYRTKLRGELRREAQSNLIALQELAIDDENEDQDRAIDELEARLGYRANREDNAAAILREKIKAAAKDGNTKLEARLRERFEKKYGDSGGGSSGSGGSPGGLSDSQQREWNQEEAQWSSMARRMNKNLKQYEDRSSAWHATAQELGGRMTRSDMEAIWWIARNIRDGTKIPKGMLNHLRSKFPGGKSPWG